MLIWGWRNRHKVIGEGTFACPNEGADRAYAHKEARRWFTLYFIPVIPLRVLGAFMECTVCGRAYDPNVLRAAGTGRAGESRSAMQP